MKAIQALPRGDAAAAKKIAGVLRVNLVTRDIAIRDRLTTAVTATGLVLERVVESVKDLPAGPERPNIVLLGPVAIKHDGVRAARAAFPDALVIAVLEDSA